MIQNPVDQYDKLLMTRIVALRDIPEHNVLKGDIGGLIDDEVKLSQRGNAWVGNDAKVIGKVKISGNALVTENAILVAEKRARIEVSENAKISGAALIHITSSGYADNSKPETTICGNSRIHGEARLFCVCFVGGRAVIHGNASINNDCVIEGQTHITGNAKIGRSVKLSGDIFISDDANIDSYVTINGRSYVVGTGFVPELNKLRDIVFTGDVFKDRELYLLRETMDESDFLRHITAELKFDKTSKELLSTKKESMATQDELLKQLSSIRIGRGTTKAPEIEEVQAPYFPSSSPPLPSFSSYPNAKAESGTAKTETGEHDAEYVEILEEIIAKVASYETDIIKVIKYPLMVDMSVAETVDMMMALKKAGRLRNRGHNDYFIQAVIDLERKYMIAESNARKTAASHLSPEQRKKTDTAKTMFALACDEKASENERRTAFTQGFRQLEGVVAVPETAIENLKKRMGMAELEA